MLRTLFIVPQLILAACVGCVTALAAGGETFRVYTLVRHGGPPGKVMLTDVWGGVFAKYSTTGTLTDAELAKFPFRVHSEKNPYQGEISRSEMDVQVKPSWVGPFTPLQVVWLRCFKSMTTGEADAGKKPSVSNIKTKIKRVLVEREGKIESGFAQMEGYHYTFRYELDTPSNCSRPSLISDIQLPEPTWTIQKPSSKDRTLIAQTKELKGYAIAMKIQTRDHGALFLVQTKDPHPIYEDEKLVKLVGWQNKKFVTYGEQGGLGVVQPVVDLDGDGVPEFHYHSSDSMDSWLCSFFPKHKCMLEQ